MRVAFRLEDNTLVGSILEDFLFFDVLWSTNSAAQIDRVLELSKGSRVDELPLAHLNVAELARLPVGSTKRRVSEQTLPEVVHRQRVDLVEHLFARMLAACAFHIENFRTRWYLLTTRRRYWLLLLLVGRLRR